ncbi:hypothetical protein H6758_02470 [Candidatus Nomurabacteria bacterium]|nr:hypothetical protein [Candidatus Nomurabacteria bacterium]
MTELAQKVLDITNEIIYMNIASVSNTNEPWNTPVYAVSDPHFNFYWRSWIYSQHSKNIIDNENVFVTIYNSTRKLGDNHQSCVYIQGTVAEMDNTDDIAKTMPLFLNSEDDASEFVGISIKKLYKMTPVKVWLNDLSERHVTEATKTMRVEVPLELLVR